MKMKWIKCSDRIPEKSGKYLVYLQTPHLKYCLVLGFAKDLYKIDEFNFAHEHRPGWFDYDSEYGCYERHYITHWAELPDPLAD